MYETWMEWFIALSISNFYQRYQDTTGKPYRPEWVMSAYSLSVLMGKLEIPVPHA